MKNVINDGVEYAILGELKHTYTLLSELIDKRIHESALDGDFANAERSKIKKDCFDMFIRDLNYYLKLDYNI